MDDETIRLAIVDALNEGAGRGHGPAILVVDAETDSHGGITVWLGEGDEEPSVDSPPEAVRVRLTITREAS